MAGGSDLGSPYHTTCLPHSFRRYLYRLRALLAFAHLFRVLFTDVYCLPTFYPSVCISTHSHTPHPHHLTSHRTYEFAFATFVRALFVALPLSLRSTRSGTLHSGCVFSHYTHTLPRTLPYIIVVHTTEHLFLLHRYVLLRALARHSLCIYTAFSISLSLPFYSLHRHKTLEQNSQTHRPGQTDLEHGQTRFRQTCNNYQPSTPSSLPKNGHGAKHGRGHLMTN